MSMPAEKSEKSRPRPARLKGADVGIPPRQLDFRIPEEMPRWAYADNATATCFLAMLSALFPPGEDFFVESVVRYRHLVDDPELRARVAGFTGQEVIHSREHDRLNEAFTGRGFDLTVADKAIRHGLDILRRLPASQQIACTAMMEHFTAVLAEDLLDHRDFRDNVHSDVAGLWLWHALEELEHKSVTYDVYDLVGNTRRQRLAAEALVLAFVAPAAVIGWLGLVAQQRAWTIPGDVRTGLGLIFGKGRFMRRVLRLMPLFHRPGFHPDDHDSSGIEAEWRERLFGTGGMLSEQLRR